MATCDLDELVADACANGFLCLDANIQAAIELQLLKEASSDTSTLDELKEQACENGFLCLDENTFNAVALQLLCDSAGGVAADIVLTADTGDNSIDWTWNKADPTNWSIQESLDGETGWTEIELADPGSRGTTGLAGVNYYRVVVVGGDYDGTISNVVFLPS